MGSSNTTPGSTKSTPMVSEHFYYLTILCCSGNADRHCTYFQMEVLARVSKSKVNIISLLTVFSRDAIYLNNVFVDSTKVSKGDNQLI